MQKVGLTIGKFAPFHKGHEYLIKSALKQVDRLYILVYETDVIDVDINIRCEWIENEFKDNKIKIIKALNPPRKYGMDEESVKLQVDYIVNILQKEKIQNVTHFFSSEEYGRHVAKVLEAENVIVDKKRVNIPINATNIRNDLEKYKQYLNKDVYEALKNT